MRTDFGATSILALAIIFANGCGQPATAPVQSESVPAKEEKTHDDDHEHAKHDHDDHAASGEKGGSEHDHSGWWCNEHGVPEEICALCSSKLAADCQKKGDWCKEHDRPDSQCFKCHPELEAKFAAQYEAKYGKQPPKPQG